MSLGFKNLPPVEASTTTPIQPRALGADTSDQIETPLCVPNVTNGLTADRNDTVIDVSEAFIREQAHNARDNAGDMAEDAAGAAHKAQAASEGADSDVAPNSAHGTQHTGFEPYKFNDAVVLGDLESVACDALLNKTIVVAGSQYAPRISADKWVRREWTWAELFATTSLHPISPNKDGSAIFFAETELTGKTQTGKVGADIITTEFVYKLKDKVLRIHAVAIDVDGTDKVGRLVAVLQEMGLLALVYTTHSHALKKTATGDRFRIIVPLDEPFDYALYSNHREAENAWKSRYVGFVEQLGLTDFDVAGMRPTQLMYMPRRASKDAEFQHYIIAGRGLRVEDMPKGDASIYCKGSGSRSGKTYDDADTGKPAFLSDGFDVRAWFDDWGQHFLLEDLIDWIGWDNYGSAGDGFNVVCPNDAAHSNAGEQDTATWACEGDPDNDAGFVITCHHDHCAQLCTWDFTRMIEENCALPDDCETLSDLLCADYLYPNDIGAEVFKEDYIDFTPVIEHLKTPEAVKRAFKNVSERASEDAYAALYAGVQKSGSRQKAQVTLDELMRGVGAFNANDLKRLKKRGEAMLQADRAAQVAEQAAERVVQNKEALSRTDLANPSMDVAEPLGDTLEEALATLGNRFALCDLDGKFRVVRKPDLSALNADYKGSTIIVSTKEDFIALHDDRVIPNVDGPGFTHPAKEFLWTEKRKSGIVFAPHPVTAGPNDFNMYSGRTLKSKAGDWSTIKDFIFRIVCKKDPMKYAFTLLWMAHMVQYPGIKPGTAIICRGAGGCGKSTFGEILAKLVSPHVKILEKEEHVVGRFAGEHLSKCILAVVTEAVFGGNPKVASELKSMVTSSTVQAEAKGMAVVTLPSYQRTYFDSNGDLVVLIEGNGSERRYFVMEISKAEKGQKDYFKNLYAAIEGDEMAALLDYLESYNPADHGQDWSALRCAPHTAERDLMAYHTLRAPVRRLLEVIRDGEVTLGQRDVAEDFTFVDGVNIRVPRPLFREYIRSVGNSNRAADGDIGAMMLQLFKVEEVDVGGDRMPLVRERRGKVGSDANGWFFEFPPRDVLLPLLVIDPNEGQPEKVAGPEPVSD